MMEPGKNEVKKEDLIIEKLDRLTDTLLNKSFAVLPSVDKALWNNTQVANYIGVTYKYANEYIVTHHTFPNPIRLPNKKGKTGHARWYAVEVIDWVSSNREH